MERENPNLLHAYNETHHSTAITYLVKKLITEGGSLNDSIIIKAHEILMRGTSNQEKINKGFRNNNNTFVGYVENGQNVIQFYPISYNEINTAIKLFCTYFNSSYTSDFNFFVNPIISHGLLAALQVFNDGNTWLSRTLEHIKIFYDTKRYLYDSLYLPVLYCSKAYTPYRAQYRDLIVQIALNPNYDTWNEWILFNLNRIQDQIFYNTNNLNRIRSK